MQNTLKTSVSFKGIGLHSGAPACLTLHPAPADSGIVFKRTDVKLGDTVIPARWDLVERSPLCTRLVNFLTINNIDLDTVQLNNIKSFQIDIRNNCINLLLYAVK